MMIQFLGLSHKLLPRKMICLQLFLLLLAVGCCYTTTNIHLIYATEDADRSTKFYRSDFNLNIKKEILTETLPSTLDKLFISNHQDDKVLYWSYKGLDNIGRLELKNNKFEPKFLKTDQKGTFIGLDSSNNLNFYLPETKTIEVISSETKLKVNTLIGMQNSTADWRFVCRNPCNVAKAYFATCSGKIKAGVFNFKDNKISKTYQINELDCNDIWALSLNADKVYGAKDKEIYRTKGKLFVKYYKSNEKIVHFAVGYNELFYATGEDGKIFKLTKKDKNADIIQKVYDVDGKVTALFAYESGISDQKCTS